jgi:O-acetyl-ADP-ribose deacetylase (regulator of RNase III)
MIEFGDGNLLLSDTEALVNTVNTVGVMGKGVALQFKQAFPENYKAYRRACDGGEVRLGRMHVWDSGTLGPRRYIINFPTKGHWRTASRIEDIDAGLDDLVRVVRELDIQSIAVPALGCGNGGLDWQDVLPRIEAALSALSVRAVVFPPKGAPVASSMLVATPRPGMSFGRAALLAAVGGYARAALHEQFELVKPGASLLEIQKLMYLVQEAGQPLKLTFAKAKYGPYAENLNHVLQTLEGHYIRGYGDRSRSVLALDPVEVLPGAEEEALGWLEANRPDVKRTVERVLALVSGWENAYGMELLGTVHFAACHDESVMSDVDRAVDYIRSWNQRKASTFPHKHVVEAWRRLTSYDWLAVGGTA